MGENQKIKKGVLTKEIADQLMKVEGEVRGMQLRNDANYVLAKKGKPGLKKVKEELEKIDYPINYEKIEDLGFYPAGLRAISLLALKKAFGWGDSDFRKLGESTTTLSWIVRIFMKFFGSLDILSKRASQIWGEYHDRGNLTMPYHSESERRAIIELKDFDLHPLYCRALEGCFEKFVKMVVKVEGVRCRETKCPFGSDKLHQFVVKW